MAMMLAETLSAASPRWETLRTPSRRTFGKKAAAIAAELGQPLMPWQQLVSDVGLELDSDTGLPAYREVIVTVMRQCGKTTLVLCVQCERCLLRGIPQRVAYTAQTGLDGRQKFVQDQVPLLETSPLNRLVGRFYRAADNTGLLWKNGSRISVLSTGQESGHGKSLDLAIIDEAFADTDDRREQALLPTMATRPHAQIWNVSTAGTEESTYLRRKVEIGRAAAERGSRSGIAYFEWSIPESEDIDDPSVWWQFIPALGHTITEDTLRHARQTMSDGEFRRAFGNQWTVSQDRVIPADVWERIHRYAEQPRPTVFAVDINPERSFGSIAVANDNEAELVEHRPGVGWLHDRLVALWEKYHAAIAIDATGPAGTLIEGLQRAKVQVQKYEARQYVYACQTFYDRCMAESVRLWDGSGTKGLEQAAAGATQRTVGDGWAWARRNEQSVISPLVALTLAVDAATKPTARPWVM